MQLFHAATTVPIADVKKLHKHFIQDGLREIVTLVQAKCLPSIKDLDLWHFHSGSTLMVISPI